jgi:hypothetical protein
LKVDGHIVIKRGEEGRILIEVRHGRRPDLELQRHLDHVLGWLFDSFPRLRDVLEVTEVSSGWPSVSLGPEVPKRTAYRDVDPDDDDDLDGDDDSSNGL